MDSISVHLCTSNMNGGTMSNRLRFRDTYLPLTTAGEHFGFHSSESNILFLGIDSIACISILRGYQ